MKDVLIVGAGITGISMAVGLKKKGLNVLLVERDRESRERFRGEYLQPYAVKGLHDLGLGSIFEKTSSVAVSELSFRDLAIDHAKISSEVVIGYSPGSVAQVIPNRELVEELRKLARSILGDRFLEGANLTPLNLDTPDFYQKPRFSLKRADGSVETIAPTYVIGCDGRQSTVREWMRGPKAAANGAPMFGAKPEFIVGCELKRSAPAPERYEVIRTFGRGTLSLFQLKSDRQRVYWNAPADKGASKAQWHEELMALLGSVREHIELDEIQIENVSGAPANTMWLGPPAKGRFFLAGDALAVTTPLGGQGMTCSRHQVEALFSLLDDTEKNSEQMHFIRERYEYITRSKYQHVNLLNLGLFYLFFAKQPMFKVSSKHILNTWNAHPEMRDRIGRLFGGDDLDTPKTLEILKLWGLAGPFNRRLSQIGLERGA
jgi:2-polyprenyl-6-methoxyphenol hydroxylase-like FAD-dependent oxidoreductase